MGQSDHHLRGGKEAGPLEARFETGDAPRGACDGQRDTGQAGSAPDINQASRLAEAVEERERAERVEQQLFGEAIAVEDADEVGPLGALLQTARIGTELCDGAGG
jgi:hypothetical protein